MKEENLNQTATIITFQWTKRQRLSDWQDPIIGCLQQKGL